MAIEVLEHGAASTVAAVGLSIQPLTPMGGGTKCYSDFLRLNDLLFLIQSDPGFFFLPNTDVQAPPSPIEAVVADFADGDALKIDFTTPVGYESQLVPDPSIATWVVVIAISRDNGTTWDAVLESTQESRLEHGNFDRENDFFGRPMQSIAFVLTGVQPDSPPRVRLLISTTVIVDGRFALQGIENGPGFVVTHVGAAAVGNLKPVTLVDVTASIVAVPFAP